jgi:hypothetical protein
MFCDLMKLLFGSHMGIQNYTNLFACRLSGSDVILFGTLIMIFKAGLRNPVVFDF